MKLTFANLIAFTGFASTSNGNPPKQLTACHAAQVYTNRSLRLDLYEGGQLWVQRTPSRNDFRIVGV